MWEITIIIIPLPNHSCSIHKLTCSRMSFNMCVSLEKLFLCQHQFCWQGKHFVCLLQSLKNLSGLGWSDSRHEVANTLCIYQCSLKYNAKRCFHAHVTTYHGNREVSVFSFKQLTANCWFSLPTYRILNFKRQIWNKKVKKIN